MGVLKNMYCIVYKKYIGKVFMFFFVFYKKIFEGIGLDLVGFLAEE